MSRQNLGSSRNSLSFCRGRASFQTGSEVRRERSGRCVVDDEPDVEALFRQQFRRDLKTQRFVMDFAVSAADALSRIADPIEQTLILILSDINMPGMTGLEMLPKVREMRPDVPIIMITAYGDPETRRKATEGGATGLLIKPIDFGVLRAEIDQRLE